MLVAVLAMSAVSASAASAALPEFKPSTKQKFTSKISRFILETRNGEKQDCTSGKTAGEIVNATQVGKVVVTLTGCIVPGVAQCNTSGKSSGEVVTNALKGELGESGTTAVLGLEPEKAGEPVAVFECGIRKPVELTGGLIGKVEPIAKEQTIFKQVWEQAGGVQKYTSFEGSSTKTTRSLHLGYSISGKEAEGAGAEAFEELAFEKRVEVT
jgi:hypothetical protein